MTNRSISDEQAETPGGSAEVPNRRLWFQVAASGVAWFSLGLADILISWRACVYEQQFGSPIVNPGAHALYFVMWALLFGLALLAGAMSYRSWRTLSGAGKLLGAEGSDRKEFMSLAGLFISFTLGIGIVWLCLPLFIIQMCTRTR